MHQPNVFFDIAIDKIPRGRLVFRLYDDDVPKTSDNFRSLALHTSGYGYRGSVLHRIIPLFMAQGGDITKHNGCGGRSSFGHRFADENFKYTHSRAGLLSMANQGPNTNTSGFFITLKPAPHLDGKHVVFGELVEGHGILKLIEAQGTESGTPRAQVIILNSGTV
ncbi:cyclophilin A [Auriculariales sp. MPI-PUGE-AT-0066]|nr:cyclophilin A [Auriculariales sp. MPI-PUGE-AT-0066]